MGDNYDNASLPGIKVDVIMGRHAGFLTAASVLARQHDEDGPHLIYVPESPLSEDKFLSDVESVYSKRGRCLIAVSEGISKPDGKSWAEDMAGEIDRDSHGNIQLSGTGALGDYLAELIKRRLATPGGKKLRVRADTFGYLQRSFPGFTSEVDAAEARNVGIEAVRASKQAGATGSIAMKRVSNEPYKIETFVTPLNTVARETKHMDASFIQNGNDVTDEIKQYVRPLVGKLPNVGTLDSLKRMT
jgi:6-phosphofructokinase 1